MWAVAQGSETPEQKHQLHTLLKALRLGLVLDDSDPAALRVGMGCDGEVGDWQPFLGAAEAGRLLIDGVLLGPVKDYMRPPLDNSALWIELGASDS
jgi:hypothetical protein